MKEFERNRGQANLPLEKSRKEEENLFLLLNFTEFQVFVFSFQIKPVGAVPFITTPISNPLSKRKTFTV